MHARDVAGLSPLVGIYKDGTALGKSDDGGERIVLHGSKGGRGIG